MNVKDGRETMDDCIKYIVWLAEAMDVDERFHVKNSQESYRSQLVSKLHRLLMVFRKGVDESTDRGWEVNKNINAWLA